MYFSEELKSAVNDYGYVVEPIYGYKFERGEGMFSLFIDKYFDLKKRSIEKGELSVGFMAKMLMNSLFGKLSMKSSKHTVRYVNKEEANLIHLYHNVYDNFPFSDNLEYIKYSTSINDHFYDLNTLNAYSELCHKLDVINKEFQTSLPVGIAITSYARMYMHKVMSRIKSLGGKIYYMDTDSLVTDIDLPSDLLGHEIGQFKLEFIANEAYFIAPKLYYLQNKDHTIIKAKTLGGDSLTKKDFIDMSLGHMIRKYKKSFVSNIRQNKISLVDVFMELNPVLRKRYPHYEKGQMISTSPVLVVNGVVQ